MARDALPLPHPGNAFLLQERQTSADGLAHLFRTGRFGNTGSGQEAESDQGLWQVSEMLRL